MILPPKTKEDLMLEASPGVGQGAGTTTPYTATDWGVPSKSLSLSGIQFQLQKMKLELILS